VYLGGTWFGRSAVTLAVGVFIGLLLLAPAALQMAISIATLNFAQLEEYGTSMFLRPEMLPSKCSRPDIRERRLYH
jgi:hypothetical protein